MNNILHLIQTGRSVTSVLADWAFTKYTTRIVSPSYIGNQGGKKLDILAQ